MSRLAVANVAVAALAAAMAIFSANLWSQLDAETVWGPRLYMAGAWATSSLAVAGWWPRPASERVLWVGALVSFAWAAWMTQFALFLNVWAHILAGGFFAATAWQAREGDGPTAGVFADKGRRAVDIGAVGLCAVALAWVLWETRSGPVDVPTAWLWTYIIAAAVVLALAFGAMRTGKGAPVAMGLAAGLWSTAPDRFQDPAGWLHGYAAGVMLLGLMVAWPHQSSGSGRGTL